MTKKFKIPAVPKTTPKNIRFPNEVIEGVEKAIQGTETSFSAFVIAATRWALESLEEDYYPADEKIIAARPSPRKTKLTEKK